MILLVNNNYVVKNTRPKTTLKTLGQTSQTFVAREDDLRER